MMIGAERVVRNPFVWVKLRIRDAGVAEDLIKAGQVEFMQGFKKAWETKEGDSGGAWAEQQAIIYIYEKRPDLKARADTEMSDFSRVKANRWLNYILAGIDSAGETISRKLQQELRKAVSY